MSNKINEDLERFNTLFGYNPTKGNQINEAKIRRESPGYRETMNEAEPEDEEGFGEEPAEEENTDFDFGGEGSPEEEATEEDEFGNKEEFSAADDLENAEDNEVEEIDVTSIVRGSDEAKQMAQQAVTVGQENMTYLKSLTDKLSNLETQLTKMDTIASKIGKLEQDIKTPEEKLELRSLDSYPFNMKLSDYWEEKSRTNDRYQISTGQENSNGQEKEYVLTPEELESDYSEVEIRTSFNPEKLKTTEQSTRRF